MYCWIFVVQFAARMRTFAAANRWNISSTVSGGTGFGQGEPRDLLARGAGTFVAGFGLILEALAPADFVVATFTLVARPICGL